MLTQERAKQIFSDCKRTAGCGPWSDQLDRHLTEGERREVMSQWDTMSGSSCFASAFFEFLNGRAKSQTTPRDLLSDIIAAGIPHDHHESDLYLLDTPHAREILARHGLKGERFTSQIDGKAWLDVPFMYSPFWESKANRVQS